MLISPNGPLNGQQQKIEVFPPADQLLSDDGRFAYRGGRIPAANTNHAALQETARRACLAVPGLRGYVGVDLIVPAKESAPVIVVEINPRLTTSYLGYRALTQGNLAEWLLCPAHYGQPITWRPGTVVFDSSGKPETDQ
jgi:predicted ATP-grasp superfamily ATP-dependent carboligase